MKTSSLSTFLVASLFVLVACEQNTDSHTNKSIQDHADDIKNSTVEAGHLLKNDISVEARKVMNKAIEASNEVASTITDNTSELIDNSSKLIKDAGDKTVEVAGETIDSIKETSQRAMKSTQTIANDVMK